MNAQMNYRDPLSSLQQPSTVPQQEEYFLEPPSQGMQAASTLNQANGEQEEYFLEPPSQATPVQAKSEYPSKKLGMLGSFDIASLPETDIGPARHLVRTGARLAEGAASGVSALPKVAAMGYDYVTGKNIGKYVPDLGKILKEYVSEPVLGSAQRPQGALEESTDNFVNLVGEFIAPSSLLTKGAKLIGIGKATSNVAKSASALQKLASAGTKVKKASQLAGTVQATDWLLDNLKVDDSYKMPIKMAALVGTTMLQGSGNYKKVKDAYYDQSRELLKDVQVTSKDLPGFTSKAVDTATKAVKKQSKLSNLVNKYSTNLSPEGIEVEQALKKNKPVPISSVINLKKELNELKYSLRKGTKTGQALKAAENEIGDVAGQLAVDIEGLPGRIKGISQEGVNNFLAAENLHSAEKMRYNISGKIDKATAESSAFEKALSSIKNPAQVFAWFKFPLITGLLKGGKLAYDVSKGGSKAVIEVTQKLVKNPKLRKAYADVVHEGLKDGGYGAFANAIKKFDKAL